MRRNLPAGTVTFLFTDVEGSTKLLHALGAEGYAAALAEHRRVVREAFAAEGGVEVDTQGDAFFVAFPTAPGALRAAEAILAGLEPGPIRLRMGLHTGTPFVAEEGYVGVDVNRAARIAAVGHGGQVLVSSSTATLLGTNGLRDLGEHRLKDLSAPERIYQLGDADFPPLTSLHRTNLPIPATPFLGREQELADVVELLGRDDVRLLTLTGPGGTGKTRLALQAVADVAGRFPHGVFWAPLAPLRDPALVTEAAAGALGAADGLADHVGDKTLLLLLDNFEHVVEAAGELSGLLAACPNVQLVVTSRELLRLPGEQAYPVPPLDPGDGERLFVARARAAQPAFEPDEAVRELCARLDNLPLALELAAARVRVLSPAQLLDRLAQRLDLFKAGRGADPRQQTLRATIEWSHDLLDDDERRLFARLAVFAGGCTLESAEAVCDAELDVLESLVDKSLVRVRDGERFWMLETIRELAAERLVASAEADELHRRHAEHFLALAEDAEPHVRAHDVDWLDRLEAEHDNLRAALDRFEQGGEWQSVLRIAAALVAFWGIRGHFTEGRRRLARALDADDSPTRARAGALVAAADLATDAATGRRHAEEALAIQRDLGDGWGEASSLLVLGDSAAADGDWREAERLWSESVRLFDEAGDDYAMQIARRLLAWAYRSLGEGDRARALHEANLERARALGAPHLEAHALEGLAHDSIERGQALEAVPLLERAYRIHVELGDSFRIGISAGRFARVLVDSGEPVTAAVVLASGRALLDEIGGEVPWVAQLNEETTGLVRGAIDEMSFRQACERGAALPVGEAVELALATLRG